MASTIEQTSAAAATATAESIRDSRNAGGGKNVRSRDGFAARNHTTDVRGKPGGMIGSSASLAKQAALNSACSYKNATTSAKSQYKPKHLLAESIQIEEAKTEEQIEADKVKR